MPPAGTTFHCVNDTAPLETITLVREACARRGVEFLEVYAPDFDYAPERQLRGGALLYRPATSMAAIRVEQFLFGEGVATFYTDLDSIFFEPFTSTLLHQRAGLPIPATVYCSTTDRRVLDGYVERLGGFPVVAKMQGGSRGVGVMRVDSRPALYSLVDYVLAQGRNPLLTAYVADAVHWRVVVIGDRAVAAYRNAAERDDFRTYVRDEVSDFTAEPPSAMAEIAVSAVRVLHNELGGVDLLEDPHGRLSLLEANFPCYFADAERVAGIDISGMMVDHLLAKAQRLAGVPARPRRAGVRRGSAPSRRARRSAR